MDEKVIMRNLEPETRAHTFEEVALGYNDEEALREANRCLQCPNPRCVQGCPVNIQIPKFIKAIREHHLEEAYDIILSSSSLPAICGRVCPQEKQCEKMCIKGFKGDAIAIGSLERYVADYALEHKLNASHIKPKNGKKVAIIGSGPSGLTCAGELAKEGVEVTIFESLHKAGGVLTYGIPEFRLPKKIVENEIDNLKAMGVHILLNTVVGKSITLEELENTYDYVYIATGAGLPKFVGIPGENANGVFSANEILTRINLMGSYEEDAKTPIKKGHKALVIGGGNVAMDAARSLKRIGYDVSIVYRRTMEELPARKMEIEHAQEEGIIFDLLKSPKEVMMDENYHVTGLKVAEMELTEMDESGRRGVKEIPNQTEIIPCDIIVAALGTMPNPIATENSDIVTDDKGLIIAPEGVTNNEHVYAGGDAVTGAATVILAMEAGKKAASQIINQLQ